MGLAYENLETDTRRYMLEEIDMDIAAGTMYVSQWLNSIGRSQWPVMLRIAAETGNDETLAQAIESNQFLVQQYEKRKPKGGTTWAAVPYTAAQTMGEGEFNRYYARGLCRRAIAEGVPVLGNVCTRVCFERAGLQSRRRSNHWSAALAAEGMIGTCAELP